MCKRPALFQLIKSKNACNFIASTKKLALTACLLCFSLAFTQASMAKPLADKSLVVAVTVAPPFIRITADFHKPTGIDVALIKELQRRTGFSTFQDEMAMMPLDEMVSLGRSGKADIVAGALSATQDRSSHYSVTEPYVYNSLCIVTRNNENSINNLKDLTNRTLAIQLGNKGNAIAEQNPDIKLHEVSSTFMTFYAVANGQADALLVDEIIALEYIRSWPQAGLKIVHRIPDTETGIALFFKKGSPNSRILQMAYQDMLDDGTVDRIVREELGQYIDILMAHNDYN